MYWGKITKAFIIVVLAFALFNFYNASMEQIGFTLGQAKDGCEISTTEIFNNIIHRTTNPFDNIINEVENGCADIFLMKGLAIFLQALIIPLFFINKDYWWAGFLVINNLLRNGLLIFGANVDNVLFYSITVIFVIFSFFLLLED